MYVYQWNLALCKNSGRVDGLVSIEGDVSPQDQQGLKDLWNKFVSGPANAGRQFFNTANLKFTPISVQPKDVDWTEGKDAASRDIVRCIGVPSMLLGIPGDNTFSNMESALSWFYNSTVIPEAQKYVDMINEWLAPIFGENIVATLDLDNWAPLEADRISRAKELDGISFLTINEKRALANQEKYPAPMADKILVGPNQVPLDEANLGLDLLGGTGAKVNGLAIEGS